MTSQKSYNNLGKNVRDQLHKMRSAILLLGVLYLAAGPVWFLLQMTSYPKYSSLPLLSNLYVGYFHVFYFLALALGTVGGFYATRYQNVPQQSNFYHSLPVTRQGLLSARILALVLVQVLLLIVVTMVDVGVVLMTASHVSGALTANLVGAAGIHFCYIMLVFLLALAVSLFAGQLTANTIGQVLMTAVLHLSVPFYFFLSQIFIYRNAVQGMGIAMIPMFSGIVELILRTSAAVYLTEYFGYSGICYASPIAWLGSSLFLFASYHYFIRLLEDSYKQHAGING